MPEQVEVLVVGGGPAGALAAASAARAGVRTLLVEAKPRVGALPHCAEFVPKLLSLEVEIPARSRVQAVQGMESILAGQAHYSPGPGWLLDRQVFDHALVADAAAAGAEVRVGVRFLGLEGETAVLKQGGDRLEVRAGAVVAADGAASKLARALGLPRPRLLVGLQYQVPLARPLERTLVWLEPAFAGGYAWLFPKQGLANLGVGCFPQAGPRRRLDELHQRLLAQGLIAPGVLARSGGVIPVQGPVSRPVQGRVLLAGDAAGLTHPITGAGIPQAVVSGRMAGEAAAALAGGKPTAGDEYAHELAGHYGRYLERACRARRRWETEWEAGEFAELMRQTWPALAGGKGRRP